MAGADKSDFRHFGQYLLRGCLPSLCELRLTNAVSFLLDVVCLRHIQRFEIVPPTTWPTWLIFDNLAHAVDRESFPNLETVCVICDTQEQIEEEFKKDRKIEENLQRLRRSGVIVHFIQSDTEKLYAEIGLS